MNENNQPQSQQTKREPGFYWVKLHGMDWNIGEWYEFPSSQVFGWMIGYNGPFKDDKMDEIDERRIERQPSHSPTEQPGDKEIIEAITRAQFGTREQSDHIERHMADYFTRWHTYKDKFTHLEWYHIFLDFYHSLPLLSEVSTLRNKQAELVAEMNRMKHYNLDAKREMASLNETIITLEAELEQLRSERDKMSEALEGIIALELDQYQWKHDCVAIAKSALSGGSK